MLTVSDASLEASKDILIDFLASSAQSYLNTIEQCNCQLSASRRLNNPKFKRNL